MKYLLIRSLFKKTSLFFCLSLFSTLSLRAANLYWVGGTGNWTDAVHWASTSGGAGGAGVPTAADNVYLDANSFSAPSQTVTINVAASCNNMDWTGVTFSPNMAFNSVPLNIYGSLTFSAGMSVYLNNGDVRFKSTTSGNTITTAGIPLQAIYFDGVGGSWTLQDDLTLTSNFNLLNGTVNTNDKNVSVNSFQSTNNNIRSINLGASSFTAVHYAGPWDVSGNNLTIVPGTSVLFFPGSSPIINCGTGTTYNNIVFSNALASGIINGGASYNNVTFTGPGTINPANSYFASLNFQNTGAIGTGTATVGKATFSNNGYFNGNNSYDSLYLNSGSSYTLTAGLTQTINNYAQIVGTCSNPITLVSNSAGSTATISSPVAITANYVHMQDVHGTGTGTFTANNSISLGNTTGWIVNTPATQNLYWVGGSGNWNDPMHWSISSGGASIGCIPTRYDNVNFDANSFTAGSKNVTINVNAECKSMNWTGAAFSPLLLGSADLNIYGSLIFISAMTNNFTGKVYFKATTSENITMAGKSFANEVHFAGNGGAWTLQDAFTISGGFLSVDEGYLYTNNQNVTIPYLFSLTTNFRGMDIGNSNITVTSHNATDAWKVSGANFTFNTGTSTITLTAASNTVFDGGAGNYYYDLVFQNASFNGYIYSGAGFNNVTFNGVSYLQAAGAMYNVVTANKQSYIQTNASFTKGKFLANATISTSTFDTLDLAPGFVYSFTSSQTINLNTIISNGTCSSPVTLQATSAGTQATLNSPSNSITVNFASIKDIKALGMPFTANNSQNLGNNTGWTINAPTAQNLYWVGGSGNWNDASHWSLTQGGAGGACVPTSADNVFFTTGSFTAGSKVVTVNVAAFCKNMNWTGAAFTPILTGTNSIDIHGTLTFISAMNITGFTGQVNFKSLSTGNTITMAGKIFAGAVYFNGVGGYWTLQDAFNTAADLYMDAGTLNSNSKSISCYNFHSTTTVVNKTLILGTSTVTVNGPTWDISGTNFILTPGLSLIRFMNSTTQTGMTAGNGVNYNDLLFSDAVQIGYIQGPINFHNVTFNGPGHIAGAATLNKADFKSGPNAIHGNSIIDSLLMAPGTTNTMDPGTMQTIGKYLNIDGTVGNLTIFRSSSGTCTISMSTCIVCCNYTNIQSCVATGGASFYANNSVNGGGNTTGWTFGACPSNTLTVGPISGSANTCANNTGYTYSIPSLGANATYTWTVPVGFAITSGQGSNSIQINTGSSSGTVSVSATDCGTTNSATLAVAVNAVPVISNVSIVPATCGVDDGSATATISGGTTPYDYQWSSGDTLALADSLFAGQYQLTLSDSKGCVTATVVVVPSSNGPQVSLSSTSNVTCPGGSNGSLTANVTGGTTPYSYSWTNGSSTSTISGLAAGVYVLTVTDSTGCQDVGTYTVTQPAAITAQFTVTPSSCAGNSGSATVSPSGGTAGYTYLWSTNAGSQTTQTASSLAAGTYTVVITDNAGCTKNATIVVSTNVAGASILLDNITAGTCGINGPGSISITASGGAFPYSFNWSNGASTEDITGVSPGVYNVSVVDANGCMTNATYTVDNAIPGYQPQICVVTVDTITRNNLVAWDKTGAVGIKEFNIYCEIGSFNNYQLVGTVPAGNLSEFVHVGANPQVKSWKYKISAVDSCGNESALSTYHKTIHLQVNAGIGGVNNLSWDNYFGFNYGSFDVWRYTLTNGWENLSTLPWCGFTVCQNSYTDGAPVPIDTNWYAIFVDPPSPCVTTARLGDPNSPLGTIVKSKSNITNNRVQGAIGITESHSKNNFSVYPNPASNEIKLVLGKDCKNCTLEISNAVGQIIRVENTGMNDNSINISNLANGVYYLKIKGNEAASVVRKLVIQH